MKSEVTSRRVRYSDHNGYTGYTSQSWSNDLIVSQNNRDWKSKTSRSEPVGGNFYVIKRNYSEYSTLGDSVRRYSGNPDPYIGSKWAECKLHALTDYYHNGTFPAPSPSSDAVLLALGREAISRTAPTSSEFDGSTFVGELREGLPRVIGFTRNARERTDLARQAGDEYLNYVFGWAPLLRELRDAANAVKNSEKIWAQYQKDAGKLIKRKYQWPVTTTTSVSEGKRQPRPLMPTACYTNLDGMGKITTTTKTTVERRFEAAYKYYLPESDLGKYLSKANRLFGINPDPAMLWNLAPWSWMADWVGDTGTLMENLSLFGTDRLVMPWAYVMETKTVTVTHVWQGAVLASAPGPQLLRQTFETQTKKRLAASPYGFNINWDGLSSRQLMILGALGLSRR